MIQDIELLWVTLNYLTDICRIQCDPSIVKLLEIMLYSSYHEECLRVKITFALGEIKKPSCQVFEIASIFKNDDCLAVRENCLFIEGKRQ